MNETILKSVTALLEAVVGDTKNEPKEIEVVKQFRDERKMATFVVLAPEKVDAHGDIYSHDAVEDACYSYWEDCQKANLEHLVMIGDDVAKVVENYITATDLMLGDQFIQKGTWLQTWKFNNDKLWEQVKAGHWTGLSVQCSAEVEYLDAED